MEITPLSLAGLFLIKPRVFADHRGFFFESFKDEELKKTGIDLSFVQDNHAFSTRGILRGMHFQSSPGQAKLIRVAAGKIFDVAVDIRPESPTFGQWEGVYLDGESHHQLFVPVGFAHGYCVISEEAHVLYKVSSPYCAETECGFQWNDPEVAIEWPLENPILSERDKTSLPLAALNLKAKRKALV